MRYEDGSGSFSHYSGAFLKRGLGGKKRLLYNLPEVIAADTVLIVEGEKKADIVAALGLVDEAGKPVAITCTGSANSWRTEFVEHLIGKRVLILPDSDEAGRRYATSVQDSLSRAGIQYAAVDFSAYGNDVRDFIADHSSDDLREFIDSPWLGAPIEPTWPPEEDISVWLP